MVGGLYLEAGQRDEPDGAHAGTDTDADADHQNREVLAANFRASGFHAFGHGAPFVFGVNKTKRLLDP